MNETFIYRLQIGGVHIHGDNGELVAIADATMLVEFLSATAARHSSHHFEPMALGRDAQVMDMKPA